MQRTTAVLYSTAMCNLNCTYCYINKNKGLKAIDQVLAESFSEKGYYFDFIREYFPRRGDLQNLEVWGAETFLHMERVYATLHRLIGHYPFFRRFFASTNFSYPEWTDKVFDLLGQFARYAPRRFDVTLQLSLDGPAHITDQTRGQGVTGKCLENFHCLLARAGEIPGNVNLHLTFKPTLSVDTMYQLDTREEILCSPGCDCCPYNAFCLRGCYGSQREVEKDPFMPIESVCRLFRGKIDFLIDKFEGLGVWEILRNLSPANARYEAARETLRAVERIQEVRR